MISARAGASVALDDNLLDNQIYTSLTVFANTQPGVGVAVLATTSTGAPAPVLLTFSSVTRGGQTTAEPVATPPPVPSGFRVASLVYDITTTATYTAPVTVCIDGSFGASDFLLHYEGGTWVQLPNQQRLPAGGPPFARVCAATTSLSPFVVGTRVDSLAPTAVIDAPARIILGDSLTVSGARSFDIGGAIVRYDWQLDSQAPVSSAAATLALSGPGAPLPLGRHDVQLVVTDDSGNQSEPASASVIVEPPPDSTPPTIVLARPAHGAAYKLNEQVAAAFSCEDADSGLASCVGTVADGARIDTANVGEKTFVVVATDAAGNTRREERRYTVVYAATGTCLFGPGHSILFPIDGDGSSRFWPGLPVPARFRVCDAGGRPINTPGVVAGFRLVQTIKDGVVVAADQPVPSLLQPAVFRWDPILKAWGYAIDTRQMTRGATHVFRITLKDGSAIDFQFALR